MMYHYLDGALTRPSDVDQARLADAKRNLERCVVVGVTEDYGGFIRDLNRTCHVECAAEGWSNASDPSPYRLSTSFERRMKEDNRLDLELYETASELISSRRG
jgi:hypothetical protein